ncbi:hypothetical protein GCM10011357_00870 [Lacimicrobium alkaliphilum]|uniref:Uncharacterized protein n=1 Tax=Lacimicrobium alkaliphilum TaxID=1526571 RepID=A0ABQ1QYR7_9ALTE|nr:hypothetical protein GCM10011357_00870 [Lacimicrobium alkaliphilum]
MVLLGIVLVKQTETLKIAFFARDRFIEHHPRLYENIPNYTIAFGAVLHCCLGSAAFMSGTSDTAIKQSESAG